MKSTNVLEKQLPSNKYTVYELVDKVDIADILSSKAASTWGSGELNESEYYVLETCSPSRLGDKMTVIVCKTKLVNEIESERGIS